MKTGDPICLSPIPKSILITTNNEKFCTDCYEIIEIDNLNHKTLITSHITSRFNSNFTNKCTLCNKKLWIIKKFITCETCLHGNAEFEIYLPDLCKS